MNTLVSATETANLLNAGKRVVRMEADSLAALEARLDETFVRAIELLARCTGRVIISGIGKSGIVGRKIAATLTSTGTPATFLHPVEGLHGDLGIVSREDVAILISKSGESDEMRGLLEYLSRLGVPIIAMTGRLQSTLSKSAAIALDCSVAEEACPHDLAPTTSTTVTLALGDALAVALLQTKGFSRDDFARIHPGGALGRKLTLTVADVMLDTDYPSLREDGSMRECVVLLAEKRGTVPIVDADRHVLGVVTAGDLTRLMERTESFLDIPVAEVMNATAKTIGAEELAAGAVFIMEKFGIMALPVVDGERRLVGIVHLHDLLRAGAV